MEEDFIRKLARRVSELEQSLQFQSAQVKQLETQMLKWIDTEKRTASALARLKFEHSSLNNYAKSLEEYCLEIDMGLRKKHLILTGIPESPEENTNFPTRPKPSNSDPDNPENLNDDVDADELNQANGTHEIALDTLANIHDTLVFEDIDLAYRIGKKKTDSLHPILIKFARESVRNEIKQKRRNLNDSDATKGSFLNEDLPPKVNQRRSDIRSIVNNAKSRNLEAKAMGDKFSIENMVYSYADVVALNFGGCQNDCYT